MRTLILLAALGFFIGCNPGNTNNQQDPGADTATPATPPPAVDTIPGDKPDNESLGDIRLGQSYSEILTLLGNPEAIANTGEWAADGLMHEDWVWEKKGILAGMAWEKTQGETSKVIFSITAMAPCTLKTKRGMGIGSNYAEVLETYKKDIDPEATGKTQITVGSIYGGIIFTFDNGKVSRIFLGAAAE